MYIILISKVSDLHLHLHYNFVSNEIVNAKAILNIQKH